MTCDQIRSVARRHDIPDVFVRTSLSKSELLRSVLSFYKSLKGYSIIANDAVRAKEFERKQALLEKDLDVQNA